MEITAVSSSRRRDRRIAFVKSPAAQEAKVAHAMQLLTSMLWAFKGTTRSAWEIASPEEADVIVYHADAPDGRLPEWQASGKLPLEIATGPQPGGTGSRALVYPFRAAQAFALLEQLDAELESADALKHAMSGHTGEFRHPAPGEDSWSFVDALRTLRAYSGGERWWVVYRQAEPVLWVKSGGVVYLADPAVVESLRQGTLEVHGMRMQSGAPPTTEAERRESHEAPMVRRGATGTQLRGGSELIWFAAYYASDRLAVALSDSARYRITRWPDFGAIRPPLDQIRVAAALSARAIDLGEAASRARIPLKDAARTLNALSALGLLLPAESGAGSVESARSQSTPTFGALGALLRNIRRHLGFGA